MYLKDVISIHDLSTEEMVAILDQAETIKKERPQHLLQGKMMASCFFEPSTRTRLSFETAMKRLGGEVVGFSEKESTSTQKGESLHDSMRVIGEYADVIVMRHPLEGAARLAAEATPTPVMNAGDGANQHPTQTLLDLFTIREAHGRLQGLNIVLAGDLKMGRTVHSLALALARFNCRLFFVSTDSLEMPEEICDLLRSLGTPFSFHRSLSDVIEQADVLYMTRFQRERHDSAQATCERVTADLVRQGKENLIVLHPLPRVDEIAEEVDALPQAKYFQQAENGLFVRQALLSMVLL